MYVLFLNQLWNLSTGCSGTHGNELDVKDSAMTFTNLKPIAIVSTAVRNSFIGISWKFEYKEWHVLKVRWTFKILNRTNTVKHKWF